VGNANQKASSCRQRNDLRRIEESLKRDNTPLVKGRGRRETPAPSASEAVSRLERGGGRLTKIEPPGKEIPSQEGRRQNLSEKKTTFWRKRIRGFSEGKLPRKLPRKWATQNRGGRGAAFGEANSTSRPSRAEDSSERNKNFSEAKRRQTENSQEERERNERRPQRCEIPLAGCSRSRRVGAASAQSPDVYTAFPIAISESRLRDALSLARARLRSTHPTNWVGRASVLSVDDTRHLFRSRATRLLDDHTLWDPINETGDFSATT